MDLQSRFAAPFQTNKAALDTNDDCICSAGGVLERFLSGKRGRSKDRKRHALQAG